MRVPQPLFFPRAGVNPKAAGNGLGFGLFLVVNATYFIRPTEIFPVLLGWHIYLVPISLCLLVTLPGVLHQLTDRSLSRRPITVCVLSLLVLGLVSNLAHFYFSWALSTALDFTKVVVYYLLLVALVNTPARLRAFLSWFALFCTAITALAVLQYHGLIQLANLSALKDTFRDPATGQVMAVQRLRGSGVFQDPNDLCLVLVVGIGLACYWLGERRSGPARFLWLGPLLLLVYALTLTHSRGGFLGFLAGLLVYLYARYGSRRMLLLSAVLLPVAFVVFAGRQTNITPGDNTGQTRIQHWSDALAGFRANPVFGVGMERIGDVLNGRAAHNSFLNCFTELGFLGGILFLGAFYVALRSLNQVVAARFTLRDSELRRLHPYVMAIVAAYAVGMASLSVSYMVITYTILGLATVYLHMASFYTSAATTPFNTRLVGRMAGVSVVFLLGLYVFIRMFIRWA
jgi:O-antigen ligase